MRKTDRSNKPDILDRAYTSDGMTELERVIAHKEAQKAVSDDEKKSFEFSRYKHGDVKKALDDMFHGKCAYCESYYSRTQPVDVEHYRPKNAVEGVDGDSGYWWLAMDWDNLLPSCIDCNRKRRQRVLKGFDDLASFVGEIDFERQTEQKSGKATAFPLRDPGQRVTDFDDRDKVDDEDRLLLDPTRDIPENHIRFLSNIRTSEDNADPQNSEIGKHNFNLISLAGAKEFAGDGFTDAKMGLTSIQVYGLNRLGLVQARTKVLRDLEFLLEMSIELQTFMDEVDTKSEAAPDDEKKFLSDLSRKLDQLRSWILTEIRQKTSEQAEYSAMAQSWLKEKIKFLQSEIDQA